MENLSAELLSSIPGDIRDQSNILLTWLFYRQNTGGA